MESEGVGGAMSSRERPRNGNFGFTEHTNVTNHTKRKNTRFNQRQFVSDS